MDLGTACRDRPQIALGTSAYSVARKAAQMYTEKARKVRQWTATRRDGQPCRAWARWGSPLQLCVVHGGLHHRGPLPPRSLVGYRPKHKRTQYTPCTCVAYAWPHRPGGGLCNWPDPPANRRTTPAGTHRWPR